MWVSAVRGSEYECPCDFYVGGAKALLPLFEFLTPEKQKRDNTFLFAAGCPAFLSTDIGTCKKTKTIPR